MLKTSVLLVCGVASRTGTPIRSKRKYRHCARNKTKRKREPITETPKASGHHSRRPEVRVCYSTALAQEQFGVAGGRTDERMDEKQTRGWIVSFHKVFQFWRQASRQTVLETFCYSAPFPFCPNRSNNCFGRLFAHWNQLSITFAYV